MVATGKPDKVKPPVFSAFELARGWRILRQHLQISVDLEKRSLSGTANFTFSAINNQFIGIALNLRRCRVTSCRVNGVEAPYRLVSPLDDDELLAAVSQDTARHRMDDIAHSMHIRDDAANEQGELFIDMPVSVSADLIDDLKDVLAEYRTSIGKEPDPDEELEPDTAIPVPLSHLPLVQLTVEYETLDPTAGAIFYGDPNAPKPVLDQRYMLTDGRFGMARFWMPCRDTMNWCDRYLFDIDVAVKPNLLVVATGELRDTVQYEEQDAPQTKVFRYRLHAPAHASEIVVAVGPFIALPDPTLSSKVTHFCLPGMARELVYTAPPIFAKALAFCREYLGGDPPSCSFKQLFVGSLGLRPDVTRTGAGGIVIHSGDLLHTSRCIDEGFIAREAIMNGLVMSYFGCFLRPRIAEDDWLISGLASHVAALGLQAILGRNWYRFRISDIMDKVCAGDSCNLANTKSRQLPDVAVDAIRRRSHIIVHMIERRIGSEAMKRALRDIVAEGKSATIAAVKSICEVLSKPRQGLPSEEKGYGKHVTPEIRELTDFNGAHPSTTGTTSVVSTGFEDAIQGVGVGPFLKRIRAIVGTDVRSMVRLWAASRGVPRLRVGYQYNARKNCIEFAVKQEGVIRGEEYSGRQGLLFTGSVNVRVMETEGVYDHTIEISEPLLLTDLPCHSRRAKTTKPTVPGEREPNDNTRGSPVLWVRLNPEHDWCMDYNFPQPDECWISLLKGERDAMAQYEACKSLSGFQTEPSMKALLSIAGDDKIYWRVRVEAARTLATNEKGLEMLMAQFRSCYMDGDEGLLRSCNFSDIAKYFVKRGLISAIASARVRTPTSLHPEGSTPLAATKFLAFLLSGHDNKGNQFDDDHYLVDLLQSGAKAAVSCVGDKAHANAGEDGGSTTESIIHQLERFRSIEAMVPRRTDLVKSAIANALTEIEIACMKNKDRKTGVVSTLMLSGRFKHNASLTGSLFELCDRQISFGSRLDAVSNLVKVYGGDLDVTMWALARVDKWSSGHNIVNASLSERNEAVQEGYYEPPSFRYQLMDALIDAASRKGWGKALPPLILALRRHTSRAMQICMRIQRVIVGEADPRIRNSALRFAKTVWGAGIPICLLGRSEYVEAKSSIRIDGRDPPKSIVAMKRLEGVLLPQTNELTDAKTSKPAKTTKCSKHGKSGKPVRNSNKLVSIPLTQTQPVEIPEMEVDAIPAVIDIDGVHENASGREKKSVLRAPRIPKSAPKPQLPSADRTGLPNLRSVPLSKPINDPKPETKMSWDPLDEEDARFLKRAWKERNAVANTENRSRGSEINNREVWDDRPMMLDDGERGTERNSDYPNLPLLSQQATDRDGTGLDGEHKKKKKKKKKRRHHDDDESGHRKKKKKKKRREEHGGQGEVGTANQHEHEEPPQEVRKIGKFKIRLGGGSFPHVAKSE